MGLEGQEGIIPSSHQEVHRPELQRRPSLLSRDLTNSPRLRNPRRSSRRSPPKSLPRRRLRNPPPKRPSLPRRLPKLPKRPRLPRRLRPPKRLPNPQQRRPPNPQQRKLPNPQRKLQLRRVRRRPKQHPRRNKHYLSLI